MNRIPNPSDETPSRNTRPARRVVRTTLSSPLRFLAILLFAVVLPAPARRLPSINIPRQIDGPSECALYPIALSAQSLANAHVGDVIEDVKNGTEPGNFGWLSWTGDPSTPALMTSLTPPGDSHTYRNPDDPADSDISVGDWIHGRPGVSNSSKVRQALDALSTLDIAVPVWDSVRGQGNQSAYRVVAFARLRLLDYQLPKENRITAHFLGFSCAGAVIETNKSVAASELRPELALDLVVSQPDAIPGDDLAYTATVTNVGSLLTLNGTFTAENFSDVVATVAYYDDLVEYQSDAGGEWMPLGGAAGALPGYTPVSPAPLTSGLTLSAAGLPATGVSYPTDGDGILGTQLRPGAVARWEYEASLVLTSEQTDLLFGSETIQDLRNTIHFEVTPQLPDHGQPFFGRQSLLEQLGGQSGDLTEVEVTLSLPDGAQVAFNPTTDPALAVLEPGASVAVHGNYQVPVLAPRGIDETNMDYLARLAAADGSSLTATAEAAASSSGGPITADPATVSTLRHVPIVTLEKSGPETVEPGATVVYDLTLNSTGSAAARELALEDLLPDGALGTISDAPENLEPGASVVAHASHSIPLAQPPGDLTDQARVLWEDANDNVYGPVDDSFTTEVASLVPDGQLTLEPAFAGPNLIGTEQTLVATLQDTAGLPLPDVSIQFNVEGPNATAGEVTTGGDGTASFTYLGAAPGFDSVQASATVDGTLLESNVASVHWIAPVERVTTSTIWGRFFTADNSGVFKTPPTQEPVFGQAFPSINFNPPAGTVPGNTSGVGVNTRPFTNVTVDLNGTYAGTIVAQGNGQQAGVGSLFNFSAVFTGEFTIAEAGNVTYDFFSDDGFIFGIGNGAERVGGANTNPPPSGLTPFEGYPVMGAYNRPTAPVRNSITVYFPEPGTYPFEIDYTECCGGQLALTLAVRETGFGVTPVGALVISPNSPQTGLTGEQQSFTVTALDASGLPLTDLTILLRVSGANTQELTAVTDGSGEAAFSYTGHNVGADIVQAVGWAQGSISAYTAEVRVVWERGAPPPSDPQTPLAVPGWIGSPANQAVLTGQVPVRLKSGITLQDGTLDYWPVDEPSAAVVLASGLSGGGTLATLDTTLLANGSYIVRLQGTDASGNQVNSGILVTVEGEYKPGRVRFTIRDLTVPVTGLPITIGRTYDSLDRDRVGDFGHGWELAIGSPRVEVNPAHDVTITLPDGRRSTFYFTPYPPSPWFGFLLVADYTPEAGVYGELTDNGCGLLTVSGGSYFCFPGGAYAPTEFTYTDPYGRAFVMGADGELRSITDLDGNTLTFGPTGIISSDGLSVLFQRDASGRITRITDPEGNEYRYGYDADGDLVEVQLPGIGDPIRYQYPSGHFFETAIDPRGTPIILNTYDDQGRLTSETDALGNVFSYSYDLNERTITLINPDGGSVTTVRDEFGNILNYTDPLGHTTSYVYDDNYNLVSQRDALGHTTSFTYDSNGNQTSRTDPLGNASVATFNQFGGPTSMVDPLGNTRTITYDSAFRPIGIGDSLGSIAAFTWSSRGNLLSQLNGEGEQTSYSYDQFGNLRSETDPLGNTVTFSYDSLGRLVGETDPLGNTYLYQYDALGRLISITDPLGQVTVFEYDANGNLTAVVDALGARTSFTYDPANRRRSVDYPDGTRERYNYDWRGNLLSHVDQDGNQTTFEYDLAGQFLRITYADGSSETFTYDAAGRRAAQTDPRGNQTTVSYNAADQLIAITDPMGNTTTFSYDAAGRRVRSVDPNGYATEYGYDARSQPVRITYPDGTMAQAEYDAAGRTLSRTDQAGLVTNYSYDAAGRMVSVANPLGQTISYAYDANSNLVALTDPNGHVTGFAYNAIGDLTRQTWPDGSFETFSYDAVGNRISHRLADGNLNLFAYDSMGRLIRSNTFDGEQVDYSYTPTGQRATATDSRGTITYAYDSRGRVTGITTPAGQSISYSYDAAGNRSSMETPAGTTEYAYDANGQLSRVTDPLGGITVYAYDPVGNLVEVTLPNGIAAAYSYDSLDRLTSIVYRDAGSSLLSFAYTLGPAGNRLALTGLDGSSTEWTYDDAYRLTGERRLDSGGTTISETTFTYDSAGNRLSMTSDGVVSNYTYNELDQLLSAGAVAFSYNARGNLAQVSSGSSITAYSYDALDRLIAVELPGGASLSYRYDSDGRMVSEEVDGAATNLLWDQLSPYGDIVLETDSSGTRIVSYVYSGTELLAQTRAGSADYYLHDGLGSVRAITDSVGTMTDSYAYTAFGELLSHTGFTANSYLYAGQRYDPATELYNFRARFYDPQIGRFLTRDPAGFAIVLPDQLNRYSYAANDPANRTDPTGMQALAEYSQQNQQSAEEAPGVQAVGRETARALERETANLRLNMLRRGDALGRQPNPGDVAHHLVEKGRRAAQPARDFLERWGIDVHSHYNGLWVDNATHYTTYRGAYTRAVDEILQVANPSSQAEALQVLRSIAERILAGTLP